MTKNGVYFIVIGFLVAELFKILIYHSYFPISRAIFSEIFTSICEIIFKQGGSAYSREFDRIFFSQMSKPKEMSHKFQNRLIAKFQ